MNKFLLTYLLAILPVSVFASQQQLQTRANTTSPSVDTNFTRQQAMNTDLYTNKADKASAVINWSAWANGASFTTSSPPVAYNGVLYKCIAPYTKNSGETPDTQTEYFAVVGGVTSYNALTDKPTIPTNLADLSADSTHRVVTDAEKSAWNAKQSPLTAGTDYLAPTGSAAGLTNFPSTLATDSEVTTAVAGKANSSAFASSAAFQTAFGWSPSGTFDTAANQTITGDWAFSSGLEASNISLNLGTLADLKIGNAQMVDDTKGNGDTNFLWSADKVFDQLATKQATLVSGTNIKTINGNSLVGSGDLTISGGSGSFTFDTFPAYEDSTHTSGIAVNGTTLAVYSPTVGKWLTTSLTDTLDPAPVTYSLAVDGTGWNGTTDTVAAGGTTLTADGTIIGLSGSTVPIVATAGSGRTVVCSGTGLTGTAPNYVGDMTANRSMACTFASAPAVSVENLWRFENNTLDSKGSVNLSSGNITYGTVAPHEGVYYAIFNGTSYMEGDVGAYTTFSVGATVKPDAVNTYQVIAAQHTAVTGNYGWVLKINSSGGLDFNISSDGTTWSGGSTANGTVTAGVQNSIVGVYDGSHLRIYKNGVQLTSGDFPYAYSSGVHQSSNLFSLGAYYQAGWQQGLVGSLDEVFFKKSALSDSDVSSIYNNGVQ